MLCRKKKKTAPQPEIPSTSQECESTVDGGRRLALRKMGLTDDKDIKAMLKGVEMLKIKSSHWQKDRVLKLQEDGMTIWCKNENNSKKPSAKHTFTIKDIDGVREGRQSEGLQKYGECFPNDRCMTIVFKGKKKNLDLVAKTPQEAALWIRGLLKLKEKSETMSHPEHLKHWIRSYLQKADKNNDNVMTFKEIKTLLKMLNIELDDHYAYYLFQKCDTSNSKTLEGQEIEEFCTMLLRRKELEEIFKRYSGEDLILSAEELMEFLKDQQENATLENSRRIIQQYELNEQARRNNFMMLDGFTMYLLSMESDIFNHDHDRVFQDMTQPLSHYFISSSHNTYLMEDQLGGPSSTEAYIRALMKGCRCVELDCWEGNNGEPNIFHGHTFTSKILFRDVIKVIKDYAFKMSPYPVILSLENHCGPEQQTVMARHLRNILGSMLLTDTINGKVPKQLPSPEELKGKILIKGKKISGSPLQQDSFNFDDDQGNEDKECDSPQKPATSQISQELSDLVVYCKSVHFRDFQHAKENQAVHEMCSFSEMKAKKLTKESGDKFVQHNMRYISRIYPKGTRTDSSNYNPEEMWVSGCQLVALNFQTPGYEMDLNQGLFRQNGNCGYVLKPNFMRRIETMFDPEHPSRSMKTELKTLIIKVITAQQLPKVNKDKNSSIVDPLVRVEIYGVPADTEKKQTTYIQNNGFNPRWDTTLTFNIRVPELALVRFLVEDYDTATSNDFVGQFTLPFTSLKQGYRHIHLLSKDGTAAGPATLFVHIKIKSV
ncbi:1-phosphatidylinositol 4,5-bisphosphate phosphodiesterase delta-3 [Protopterus annectens]|uniref:1-phosphatidylinositol 4,5-bisphosphate phosphodiesterase delta-3 n=1 Tax=Protopterus annectens TaxID=7888 RepID=UPI001CF9A15B|nr:1-phosphatidylinositol 4,5-bisphosphate phosphodiesterase delta-3 [Protopterus annectens]